MKHEGREDPDVGLEEDLRDAPREQLRFVTRSPTWTAGSCQNAIVGRTSASSFDCRSCCPAGGPGRGAGRSARRPRPVRRRRRLTMPARAAITPLPGDSDVHAGHDQQGAADRAAAEHPVHDRAARPSGRTSSRRAPRMTPRRQADDGRQHAGRRDAHPVDVHVVRDEPLRQRDEAAEDEEVVEAEPPHAHAAKRGEALARASGWLVCAFALVGEQEEHHAGGRQGARRRAAAAHATLDVDVVRS